MEYVTLIEKCCGHFGLVKNKIPGDKINCSQCSVLKGPEHSLVSISKKKVLPRESVPELAFEKMEKWLRNKLGEIKF